MTTDTPSTSGEGVDVLAIIKAMDMALDDANVGVPKPELCVKAICRIADLIEAASLVVDEAACGQLGLTAWLRLDQAVDACRATQGAHP